MNERIDRNVGLELVRATEAAALSAGRWMGLGQRDAADDAATGAMAAVLATLDVDARIVIGEEGRSGSPSVLAGGMQIGRGRQHLDMVVDPIDGRRMLAEGRSGAIAVAAVALPGAMWSPAPADYADKIVVGPAAAAALVPECLDAPAAWTLALVARASGKAVRDLVVFVLDRPRHAALIAEIRTAGARVMLRGDGDVAGALMASTPGSQVDLLMGIGGAAEGVIAACAVRALRGAMLVRLAPQYDAERAAVAAAGIDTRRVLTADELVAGDQIFFAATGIADGPLLRGVRYAGERAETYSLVLRNETGTRRSIFAEHVIGAE